MGQGQPSSPLQPSQDTQALPLASKAETWATGWVSSWDSPLSSWSRKVKERNDLDNWCSQDWTSQVVQGAGWHPLLPQHSTHENKSTHESLSNP